jgi:membrane protein implicated in regulation of membrane protease activity
MILLWFYYGFTMLLWFYHGFTMVLPWFHYGFTMVSLCFLTTKATSHTGQVSMTAELTGSLITPRRRRLRRCRGRAADLPSRPHLLGENHLEI